MTRRNCSSETSGPIWVSGSMPGPSLIDLAISATPSTTSSNRPCWTNSREPAHAALAVVEEDRVGGALDRAVVGVVEDDVGALAAELQGDLLQVARAAACTISLPTSVEPVNATLSTSGCAASAAPAVSPKPGDHVDHAVGHAGLGDQLGQPQRGQRGLLGRLEHHGVAGGQRRAELPRGHQQREVPRDDLPDDADRLAQRVGVEVRAGHVGHRDVDRVALDLGGPAGHVVEQVRGQRHVGGRAPRRTACRCPATRAGRARRRARGSGRRCAR